MAAVFTKAGIVTEWGTDFDASPVADLIHRAATWTQAADDINYPENAAGLLTSVTSLRTITGTIDAMLPTPQIGNGGAVAYSDGYAANVQGWNLNINYSAVDTTSFGVTSTTNRYRTFIPGNYEWSGTYNAIVDNDTKLEEAGEDAPGDATFTLASSNTFAGKIYTTQISAPFTVNGLAVVTYAFRGSGALTAAGTNNAAPIGALAAPTTDELTFRFADSDTDGTLAIDAFWTSLSITVAPGDMTTVQLGWQGSGAVTNNTPSA